MPASSAWRASAGTCSSHIRRSRAIRSSSTSPRELPTAAQKATGGSFALTVLRLLSVTENLQFWETAAMKTTLTVSSRGVVKLPAKLRKALGLKAEDLLIAETTPEGLLLRPAITLAVEMYTEKRIREFEAA